MRGDDGIRFENAVAAMLLKQVHFRQDSRGKAAHLHYIRTKDGSEVDFALSEDQHISHLIECKLTDSSLHRPLASFAGRFPSAKAIQLVRNLRQEEVRAAVHIADAAEWLAGCARRMKRRLNNAGGRFLRFPGPAWKSDP